jgi:glycosyltransferase involved in cell wall biosynthesis
MSFENKTLQVLICTHNRTELLQRAIHYLNQATRPKAYKISLFVVANACTDTTAQYLAQYQATQTHEQLNLEWFSEPVPGKSNALNSAIPKLTANIIAMVDDNGVRHFITDMPSKQVGVCAQRAMWRFSLENCFLRTAKLVW